jgi:hypothetical protein
VDLGGGREAECLYATQRAGQDAGALGLGPAGGPAVGQGGPVAAPESGLDPPETDEDPGKPASGAGLHASEGSGRG